MNLLTIYDGMGTGDSGCLCTHYSFSKTWVVWEEAGFRRSGAVDQELNRYQPKLPRARFPKQNHLSFALKCWEDCERPSFEGSVPICFYFFKHENLRIAHQHFRLSGVPIGYVFLPSHNFQELSILTSG